MQGKGRRTREDGEEGREGRKRDGKCGKGDEEEEGIGDIMEERRGREKDEERTEK